MTNPNHEQIQRRVKDWKMLELLAARQSWMQVRCIPDPRFDSADRTDAVPLRIEIEIDGKGVASAGETQNQVEFSNQHHIHIEFPDDYPQARPAIQLVSPLFHPNIAAGGKVNLEEIGLSWQPAMTLDIICERIWDAIRGAYIDLETVANIGAGQWYASQRQVQWPVDARWLALPDTNFDNVVKYRRKRRLRSFRRVRQRQEKLAAAPKTAPARTRPKSRPQHSASDPDVLFINDSDRAAVDAGPDQPPGSDRDDNGVHLIRE